MCSPGAGGSGIKTTLVLSGHAQHPVAVLAAMKGSGGPRPRDRVLVKGDQAYQDGVDFGGPAMAWIARDYGYNLSELRKR